MGRKTDFTIRLLARGLLLGLTRRMIVLTRRQVERSARVEYDSGFLIPDRGGLENVPPAD